MPDDDDLDAKVRKLVTEHRETRWLALRLDTDVKEMRIELRAVRDTQRLQTEILTSQTAILAEHSATLAEHTARFDSIDQTLTEHSVRFGSVDSELRSLTQLVGQVLDRLPEQRGPSE